MDGEHPGGGSLELARLIDEYGQHLVPDLNHYYRIDLRDLFSEVDPLDPKWVLIHVANLPIASAFVAAQRGGIQFRGWGQEQYTAADMVDSLSDLAYILIMAHRDPNKPAPHPPKRYPRPSDKPDPATLPDDQKTSFKAGSFGDMLQQAKRNKRARLAAEAARQGA